MNLQTKNKIKAGPGAIPMANLVLLLLFFFIILSLSSSKNQFPVQLPKASADMNGTADSTKTTVVITENNQYFLLPSETAEQARGFDQVKDKLLLEVGNSGEARLKIAGHKNANYEALFNVLALAQANGWQPVIAYDK